MIEGLSSLAQPAAKFLKGGPLRSTSPYGLCVHTTGSSIVAQAIQLGRDPLDHAVSYYLKPDSFWAHYVCGWDGRLVQISDETVKASHIGFTERAKYLEPDWETLLPVQVVRLWRNAWPAFPSPAYLFQGKSANDAYVGVELLPLVSRVMNQHEPAYPGSSFTQAQHQMVVVLVRDIAERWGWPKGWEAGPRLLAHEDVNPITRSDKGGGWDPGALRVTPRFSWRWVREICAERDPGPIAP